MLLSLLKDLMKSPHAYCKVATQAFAAPGVSAQRKYSFFCGVPISCIVIEELKRFHYMHSERTCDIVSSLKINGKKYPKYSTEIKVYEYGYKNSNHHTFAVHCSKKKGVRCF